MPAFWLGTVLILLFSVRLGWLASSGRAGLRSLILPAWVVHRDPRWFEDPEAFRPERWAGDLARRLPRFAYFPFGGGPRQCIGNAFAMMEAVLLLATIAQRFRLTMEPGQRVTPTPYVTLRPEPGLRMRLARR